MGTPLSPPKIFNFQDDRNSLIDSEIRDRKVRMYPIPGKKDQIVRAVGTGVGRNNGSTSPINPTQ